MADDVNIITTEDIDWLNRTMIARSANATRIAATVLMAVSAVGAVLSLWMEWRYQNRINDVGGSGSIFSDDPEVGWMDRVDGIAQLYNLVLPAMGIALGLALRLAADYMEVRTGGSLGPVAVGDNVPPAGPDDAESEPVLPTSPEDFEPRT